MFERLPNLQPSSHQGCWTVVDPAWLSVVWEELEFLEEVCPYAEGACSKAAADEIVAGVSEAT